MLFKPNFDVPPEVKSMSVEGKEISVATTTYKESKCESYLLTPVIGNVQHKELSPFFRQHLCQDMAQVDVTIKIKINL